MQSPPRGPHQACVGHRFLYDWTTRLAFGSLCVSTTIVRTLRKAVKVQGRAGDLCPLLSIRCANPLPELAPQDLEFQAVGLFAPAADPSKNRALFASGHRSLVDPISSRPTQPLPHKVGHRLGKLQGPAGVDLGLCFRGCAARQAVVVAGDIYNPRFPTAQAVTSANRRFR